MEVFEIVFYALLCIFGACIGSFMNVVALRVPKKESFTKGRSHCPKCQAQLKWYELIPIVSWLIQRGRCRSCKKPISPRYVLVEAGCALLTALSFARWGFDWRTPLAFGVLIILLAIALIDYETMEIPNGLVLALIPFAIGAIWAWRDVSIVSQLIGMAVISLPMLGLALLIPNAFGGGDMKLMAVCGFLLGWKNTLFAFFVALLLGGGYGIYLLLSKKAQKGATIPFGPYLCIGIAVAMFYGKEIINLYLGLFGL